MFLPLEPPILLLGKYIELPSPMVEKKKKEKNICTSLLTVPLRITCIESSLCGSAGYEPY